MLEGFRYLLCKARSEKSRYFLEGMPVSLLALGMRGTGTVASFGFYLLKRTTYLKLLMAIGAQMPPEEAMLTASQECIFRWRRKGS